MLRLGDTEIIERASPPARVDVDPVTLDIIENALGNIRHEMDAVLFQTAMSPGIREQHDEFPLIADREGRMVVGQFGSFIHGFLSAYGGRVEEGDVFFTSDPYLCDGAISHANDWLVLIPIFRDELLIGWASMFGHMTDVGGKVPGSLPTDARTIYEEGVIVPPMKLYRRGELAEEALEVVLNQVRIPTWNRADLNGVVAGCRTAERRILELCDRFGVDVYMSTLEELLERNRRAMGRLIQEYIPEEPVSFVDYVDDDGLGYGPYRLECAMWRDGDRVILDWEGTSPQSDGPINYLLNENILKMYFGIYMIMVFDPQILWNDGFYPLVEIRYPDRSLLTPERPAALSCRTHALGRVFDILGGLLGQHQPHFLNGAGFSSSPHLMYSGRWEDGEWFQLYQIGFGGVPGRREGDGPDGHSMWPSFTNIPNEYLERYFPLRIERYVTVPDSGGPGLHRGGNGVETAYRFLRPGEISIHDDRWFTHPWGVNGGEPAARSRKILERADGRVEVLPSKCDGVQVSDGDLLRYITWGGGGWGDPLERDPELVALEVARGLVTPEGARRYGVVLADDTTVDRPGTERLRAELRRDQLELPTFNLGPPMEALRARSEEETGLPAPAPPGSVPDGLAPLARWSILGGTDATERDLEGAVVVMLGVSGRLERALTNGLERAGATVIVGTVERDARSIPPSSNAIRRIVAPPERIAAEACGAADAVGGIDILVVGLLDERDGRGASEWTSRVEFPLLSAFRASREAVRRMREGGALLFVTAGDGEGPVAVEGIGGLSRSLVAEFGPQLRSNVVLAGWDVAEGPERGRGDSPNLSEITEVVRFLASPAGRSISGSVVRVDGGRTAVLELDR